MGKLAWMQSTNERMKNTDEAIEKLHGRHIPKGIRLFAITFETMLLDTTAIEQETVSWKPAARTTMREAKVWCSSAG